MKTIIIVWAGAAWLMTAASIVENLKHQENYRILIFEKNKSPGNKIIISGWGRCNITTTFSDKKILAEKYVRGWDFIKKSMGKFSPQKTGEWFEKNGIPLKAEWERIFPISNNGHDVVDMFDRLLRKQHNIISFHYQEGVQDIQRSDDQFIITTKEADYKGDILVITTGWNAYAHTGSSGDGYMFGKNLWHSVTKLWPSLSSFLIKEIWIQELSGLTFENAQVHLGTQNKESIKGALLFTHFGISWPLAFMLAAHLAWDDIKGKKIFFTPFSDMNETAWENFLREAFELSPRKFLANILEMKLPKRFVEVFLREYAPTLSETIVSWISRKNRELLAKYLWWGISLEILARRPGDEFVTAWGIDTNEIYPETLESKITKNLFFAGEILNVDGYTWWFSLQICWSSGYAAGKSIQKILSESDL